MTVGLTTSEAISVREAMELIGLTRQAIYNAIINGRVAAEKVGHVYLVDRRSLLKYLRSPLHRGNQKE